MELTQEQYAIVKQGIGPTDPKKPRRFTRLTGAMLRDLINKGGIVLPDSKTLELDAELFKSGHDETALKFLETNPRFFVQGWLGDTSVVVDTIWGAKDVRKNENGGGSTVTFLTPKLTKTEIFDFANTFHRADEFTLHENYAYAWFD